MLYLYLRNNQWFQQLKVLKVGIFGEGLKDGRHGTYITGEPRAGYFKSIWEINEPKEAFDGWLKRKLKYKLYIDPKNPGGTEFYEDNSLQEDIETILKEYKINHKKLNKEEIDLISRKKYNTSNKLKDKIYEFDSRRNKLEKISLYKFQEDVDIVDFLKKNKRGILNWVCRLGKTIKSIDTLIKLGCKKICIGVPSTQLLKQWYIKLKKYCSHKIILLGDTHNPDIKKEYNENIIILTTYNSSYKIKEANIRFDLKILTIRCK